MWPWKKNIKMTMTRTIITNDLFEIMLKNAAPDRIDAMSLDLTLVEGTIVVRFPRAIWAAFKEIIAEKGETEFRKTMETSILSCWFGVREDDLSKTLDAGHALLVLAKKRLEEENKKQTEK